jgi:hypothetical protein
MKAKQWPIIYGLLERGYITRNECLSRYISRLGARICDLETRGWTFKTERVRGDYLYRVTQYGTNHLTGEIPTANLSII